MQGTLAPHVMPMIIGLTLMMAAMGKQAASMGCLIEGSALASGQEWNSDQDWN